MTASRRTFLQQLSSAAALGLLSQVPGRRLWAMAPGELVPEWDEALLRELALEAVGAARGAGATFADVRVTGGQRLEIQGGFDKRRRRAPGMSGPSLALMIGYSVRAIVDGAWGFAAGDELGRDAVVQTARAAVARARANRPRRPRALELAPVPKVADGRWVAPIAKDPFAVAAGAQADLQLEALAAAAALPEVQAAELEFAWQRTTRVFASSDGSLLAQRVALALPRASVVARAGDQYPSESASIEGFEPGAYGYEAVARVNLPEELRRTAERAVERSKRGGIPPSSVEVGRYDLVLGPGAMAAVLVKTIAEALNAERALGYRANHAGTSFAAPTADVLGRYRVGSSLLTVRADRTRPQGAATVGWDDEGAPSEAFTLVQDGVIVDYLTDRQCASELGASYRSRGEVVRSHGCALGAGQVRPGVRLPNLALAPGKAQVSLDDLIADTRRGFYLEDVSGSTDQQVLSGQFGASGVRAIRNGKVGAQIKDFAFQFVTPELWKGLDALGGPATVATALQSTGLWPYDPLQLPFASVSTVPGRFRQVNVLNTGRTA
jgi:TldD protein